MNVTEHLLACLAEECAEVQKEVGKALRFGLDDRDPTIAGALTQRELIANEFYDILAVIEMLEERDILRRSGDTHAIERKKAKVEYFLDYARNNGVLSIE